MKTVWKYKREIFLVNLDVENFENMQTPQAKEGRNFSKGSLVQRELSQLAETEGLLYYHFR